MNERIFTLCVFSANSPGVLQRITVLFTRRKLNIESLTVSETERQGISRYTIVIRAERETAEKVAKQIQKIVEVSDVLVCENDDLVFSEIAFYRVRTIDAAARQVIEEIVTRNGARIVHTRSDCIIVEKAGTEEELNVLFRQFEPLGIREFVRSGRIAMLRNARAEEEWSVSRGTQGEVEKNSLI